MNNTVGLSAMINYPKSISILALGFETPVLKTRATVLELLGAVCSLPNGHKLVMEAVENLRAIKCDTHRYQSIVASLALDDPDYQVSCMAFINAVVNEAEELEVRQLVRYDMLDLGLTDSLELLSQSTDKELKTLVQVFEQEAAADLLEVVSSYDSPSVDQNDIDDLHASTKNLICTPESFRWFLHCTRAMYTMSCVDAPRRAHFWHMLADIVDEILLQRNDITLDYHKLKFNVTTLVE